MGTLFSRLAKNTYKYDYLAITMQRHLLVLLFLFSILFFGACCKDENGIDPPPDKFANLTQKNELPYRLPTISNQSDGDQTKGLSFYGTDSFDVIFRAVGRTDANTSNTKLWVQILHPDIKVFADTRIDSFYRDTTFVNGVQTIEVHNKPGGINFYQYDTALLALPFNYDQLESYRPRLYENTVVTVHVQFSERIDSTNIIYNVERGVLKRVLHNYVGFKNVKDGRLFFVELESRYVLKSIETRTD